jgi:hypothetical protein
VSLPAAQHGEFSHIFAVAALAMIPLPLLATLGRRRFTPLG